MSLPSTSPSITSPPSSSKPPKQYTTILIPQSSSISHPSTWFLPTSLVHSNIHSSIMLAAYTMQSYQPASRPKSLSLTINLLSTYQSYDKLLSNVMD